MKIVQQVKRYHNSAGDGQRVERELLHDVHGNEKSNWRTWLINATYRARQQLAVAKNKRIKYRDEGF